MMDLIASDVTTKAEPKYPISMYSVEVAIRSFCVHSSDPKAVIEARTIGYLVHRSPARLALDARALVLELATRGNPGIGLRAGGL